MSARWLLNLAHMTLGTYLDGVRAEHRIPVAALRSSISFPHFANVAQKLGLNTFALLGGLVIDDFDNDDDLDIPMSCWNADGQLRIDRLEIRWPKSGETQAFEDVAVDRLVRIVEGAAEPVPLILSRTKSGG